MDGNTARGASSPAKPALHMPDPLSNTSEAASSCMAANKVKLNRRSNLINVKRLSRDNVPFRTQVGAYYTQNYISAIRHIWKCE